MMTNSKLLEEIISRSQNNNEILREKLKEQVLKGTNENSRSMMAEFSERYKNDFGELKNSITENVQLYNNEIKKDQSLIFNKMELLIKDMNDRLNTEIQKSVHETECKIMKEISSLREELNKNIDEKFNQTLQAVKSVSDNMDNLQKDNAIIMQTLQLILANMLLEEVDKK